MVVKYYVPFGKLLYDGITTVESILNLSSLMPNAIKLNSVPHNNTWVFVGADHWSALNLHFAHTNFLNQNIC